jgi:hypothetical protein
MSVASPHAQDTRLSPGLSFLLERDHLAEAVEVSEGSVAADQTSHASHYGDDSLVPTPRWRRRPARKKTILTADAGALLGDWLSVVSVPDHVLAAFKPLRQVCGIGSQRELTAMIRGPEGRIALVDAIRYATTMTDPDQPEVEGPAINFKIPSGTPTLTTGRHERFTGLHVDSWYQHALADRAGSPNRISINLGPRDRFFLCVNLPVQRLAELLAQQHPYEDGHRDAGFGLPRSFLRRFPDYPVTRIRIRPGEAYLSPTENIIHDGYAPPQGQIDLQFSCRGYFRNPDPSKEHFRS